MAWWLREGLLICWCGGRRCWWCSVVRWCGRRVFKHPVWGGDLAAVAAEERRVLAWCTGEFHTDQVLQPRTMVEQAPHFTHRVSKN